MPRHGSNYDPIILGELNAFSVPDIRDQETFKPHLTFTELLRRIQRTYPSFHRKTLERRLYKMVKWGIVLRYSSGSLKLARSNPVFYRLNPETSGEIKLRLQDLDTKRDNESDKREYTSLSTKKRLGNTIRNCMIVGEFAFNVKSLITRDGTIVERITDNICYTRPPSYYFHYFHLFPWSKIDVPSSCLGFL